MRKSLLPLLFLFLFIFESLFVQFLPAELFDSQRVFVPHFLITAILFLTIFGSEKHGIIYGMIFGLLFDIVYTEILGIYLFLYPLMAYFISKMMKVLQVNILIAVVVSLIGVALLEVGVFGINKLIGVTHLPFLSFLNMRFFPTLLLNATFMIMMAYPLKQQFEKYAEALRTD